MAARKKITFGGHGAVEKDESEVRWLISYSDFMMQLVCLFILLYSVSSLDPGKAAAFVASYRASRGLTEPPAVRDPGRGDHPAVTDRSLMGGRLGQGDVPPNLQFKTQEIPGGYIFTFLKPLFETGSAALLPQAGATLDEVAKILRSHVGSVFVTGYALRDVADRLDGDAMKLSQARAESVVVHLTREGFDRALDPRIVVAEGGGVGEGAGQGSVVILLRTK